MNYEYFNVTEDHAYNLRQALDYCKEKGVTELEFNRGTYEFYPELASQSVCCIANHGCNGFKSIAFLLQDMQNFTLDGGGSTFVIHGVLNPFVLNNCKQIVLKNFSIYNPQTFSTDSVVTAVNNEWFELQLLENQPYRLQNNQLYFLDVRSGIEYPAIILVETNPQKKLLVWDAALRVDTEIKQKAPGVLLFKIPSRPLPTPGNHAVLLCSARNSPNIFMQNCSNVTVKNHTAYSAMGMGLIAQKCKNITVDGMKTALYQNRSFSLNADATHFVNCSGTVRVVNSSFCGQLDDALNVHGIYTRVFKKGPNNITVQFVHKETKGIDLYRPGEQLSVVDPLTLLQKGEFTIQAVQVLNNDCVRLTLNCSTENISIGDSTELKNDYPTVVFENNTVEYNRGRGILLASRAKTVVKNNYFHVSGPAILLESNGDFWFESGPVRDAEITHNTFDNCCYAAWDKRQLGVIHMAPRAKVEPDCYYHGRITIEDNCFTNSKGPVLTANNVEKIKFLENKVCASGSSEPLQAVHCKTCNFQKI